MQRAQWTAAFLALGLVACGGGGAQSSAGKPASSAPVTSVAKAADFGVPECDEYINKYQACIDSKVPEAARQMVRQSFDQTKASWKQAAATPEGKAGLSMSCKMALDAARTAMQAYGCQW